MYCWAERMSTWFVECATLHKNRSSTKMVGGWKRVFYKILWRKQSIAVCVLLVTMVLLNRVFYHLFTEYRCTHEILDKKATPQISAKNKTGKYAVIVAYFRREEGVGRQRRGQPCGVVWLLSCWAAASGRRSATTFVEIQSQKTQNSFKLRFQSAAL